ncbi:glycosyltransferase family 2 protein [Halopseudomonas salegens]|uniref:Glycosyltransferase involved in cell wall bisynthesis n=1 Tax=Halopseudomonas salegens TaxID=1434072 RepID=A0A1H2HTU1_9GAMM|nr:glycosyltransferase family 2 protein [Halopseudomonas salegens]SDU35175.1 Glycosyltransferase involved in cell wall bisynthesis [Halopseudomonas salegens]
MAEPRIAVVIPCFNVASHILEVLARVPAQVERIYLVDDDCPEKTADLVEGSCIDPRLSILRNETNLGVGGAVIAGYQQALQEGMDIVVKLDGDGQMDPGLIPRIVRPIVQERADYTKGNRFYRLESLRGMPVLRLIGNAGLSFLSKLSCGYWNIMDPTNGYTAIHASVLREVPLDKLAQRYFFETDMLFRLNTLRAVVQDVPIDSVYADEKSGLKIHRILPDFLGKHLSRFFKRYAYNYWLRDFNAGSLYSFLGLLLLTGGSLFGIQQWMESVSTGVAATSGTVMLSALPVLIGIQLLLAFIHIDIERVPNQPLHPHLNTNCHHENT